MRPSLLLNIFLATISLLVSCFPNDAEEIPEICYEQSGLISWTVNDISQLPDTSVEPNSGINLDFLYSIDTRGSWSINFRNETYTVVFADFDNLVSNSELDDLEESEWEKVIVERGSYDFVFEPEGRQELFLNTEDPLIFLGDSAEEVLGGEVKITLDENSTCKFLVLNVTAVLGSQEEPYTVRIELTEPYLYD